MRRIRLTAVHGSYIVLSAAVVSFAATGKTPTFDQKTLTQQVALDRAGFSPGEIDGRPGTKTTRALDAYTKAGGAALPASDPLTTYTISEQDAAGPFTGSLPHDMMELAKLPSLGYTSLVEELAEKFHSSPNLLKQLNPQAAWKAGESIKVPNVEPFELPTGPEPKATAAAAPGTARNGAARGAPARGASAPTASVEILIDGATKSLEVRDGDKVVMYAPITSGSEHDPLPIGEWKVTGVSWNPVFNYNPDLFWDAEPSHTKAKIPAGPNGPVGVVWVDINKPHFGLHGTPEPSTIGRTESHGCVRLTNWDATKLARAVSPGTKVTIQ